jgi:cysteinyl-tRNA synthetase
MQELVQKSNFIEDEVATYKYIFQGSTQVTNIDEDQQKDIEILIRQRDEARKNNDFDLADKIRDKLSKMNVTIRDIDGKTEWKI